MVFETPTNFSEMTVFMLLRKMEFYLVFPPTIWFCRGKPPSIWSRYGGQRLKRLKCGNLRKKSYRVLCSILCRLIHLACGSFSFPSRGRVRQTPENSWWRKKVLKPEKNSNSQITSISHSVLLSKSFGAHLTSFSLEDAFCFEAITALRAALHFCQDFFVLAVFLAFNTFGISKKIKIYVLQKSSIAK